MTYTYITFDDEDQRTFKRIASALEGIESRVALIAPAKAVECGPETGEAVRKLLSDIAGDIEEELKAPMERACAWTRLDAHLGPENLYMTAVGDFMEVFKRALDRILQEGGIRMNDREILQALLDGKVILVEGMCHSFRYRLIGDRIQIRFKGDGWTPFDCIPELDSDHVKILEGEE